MENQLSSFPEAIITRMLECQVEQGNAANRSVFETYIGSGKNDKGFDWGKTSEGGRFWRKIIVIKDFSVFPLKGEIDKSDSQTT